MEAEQRDAPSATRVLHGPPEPVVAWGDALSLGHKNHIIHKIMSQDNDINYKYSKYYNYH
jgi:hypothetical protein